MVSGLPYYTMATDVENAKHTTAKVPQSTLQPLPQPPSEVDHYVAVAEKPKSPWWAYLWDYYPGRSKQETRFVQKLDAYLITMLSLGYFIKNLSDNNLTNAFVSGMKEDLSMYGKELNYVNTAWTVGYVVGQLPSQYILTRVRPSIWIPSCELAWSVMTFALAGSTSVNHLIAFKFLIGLFESPYYPAAHTVLGSWYKPGELAKRACIFHASSAAAGMFSGYLQAGIYKNMNGLHGLAGWKWLFIMDGVISVPIAIAGYFLFPDVPEITRAFYLTEEDKLLAKSRMASIGRAKRGPLGKDTFKRVLGRWHVWALTPLYIIFLNRGPSFSTMSLWLKAQGYSVSQVNVYPTGQSAVQLVTTVGLAILADYMRKRWPAMHLSTFFGFFSSLCLLIWNIPVGLKWYAFYTEKGAVAYGPLSMSWANEICGADAEERALVIGIMNTVAYAFNAWVPLLTFPQDENPRFKKGFAFATAIMIAQFGITSLVAYLHHNEKKKKKKQDQETIEELPVGSE